jgi:hypothetical protein
MNTRPPQPDHLVIAATTLDEGVAWCKATLGATPGPGGEHALFGTHNRLLKLNCDGAPNAYLEIIAINPAAAPLRGSPCRRWFDLDAPALRKTLDTQGPQLVHWVASVPSLSLALATCRAQGIERGEALTASRPTPNGLLEWQISVREDGQRLFDGCMPTLIQWGKTHPAAAMPASGLRLRQLSLAHPQAEKLQGVLNAIGLRGVTVQNDQAAIYAEFDTPRGTASIRSVV